MIVQYVMMIADLKQVQHATNATIFCVWNALQKCIKIMKSSYVHIVIMYLSSQYIQTFVLITYTILKFDSF